MNFQECDLGFTHQAENTLVFFGNKNADLDKIKVKFPSIEFLRLKQTHSNSVLEASLQLTEADSHWTSKSNTGLLIATADCLPIMICNNKTGVISAVHAGWRGVENQITLKTLKKIITAETKVGDLQVWIGPHILQKSFEVEHPVLNLLLKSYVSENPQNCYFATDDKFFIDLVAIIKSQISSCVGRLPEIFILEKDTKAEALFHSFRRDKSDSGRNLSFIARCPQDTK